MSQTNRLILFLIILITALPASAEIIFQDNFDSCDGSACTVNASTPPSGWYEWHVQGGLSAECNSETKNFGEITTPGRGGNGKSLKVWRCGTAPTHDDYTGVLGYWFSGTVNSAYFRYYLKLPPAMDATLGGAWYVKSWRINTTAGSTEIYFNFNGAGSLQANGSLQVYDGGPGWTTLISNSVLSSIWDGEWHCLQFLVDISGSHISAWVDGVQTYDGSYSYTATGNFLRIQHFGVGNYSSDSTWQSTWQAMEFDDFIIATTKAETDPIDVGGASRTAVSSGLTTINIGRASISQ